MEQSSTTPDLPTFRPEAEDLVAKARSFVITTPEQFAEAGEFVKTVAALKKRINERFDPLCESAHAHHKMLTNARTAELAVPMSAEAIVRPMLQAYLKKEATERAAAEAAAQAAAKKQQEDARISEAEALDNAGLKEEATAVLDAPVSVAPVRLAAPKVKGISTAKVWKYEILDATKLDRTFLMPNDKAIGAQVKSLGADAAKFLGEGAVRIWSDDDLRVTPGK